MEYDVDGSGCEEGGIGLGVGGNKEDGDGEQDGFHWIFNLGWRERIRRIGRF